MANIVAVNELANALQELVLRANGQRIGKGKRIIPALAGFNSAFAQEFSDSFQNFFTRSDLAGVIDFADRTLTPFGGRLVAGYSSKG